MFPREMNETEITMLSKTRQNHQCKYHITALLYEILIKCGVKIEGSLLGPAKSGWQETDRVT